MKVKFLVQKKAMYTNSVHTISQTLAGCVTDFTQNDQHVINQKRQISFTVFKNDNKIAIE